MLRRNSLFISFKKCNFLTNSLVFLGYIVSAAGIKVDDEKVKIVREWPLPKSIAEVSSFNGLASFYPCFVWNFNTIAAPLTNCLKQKQFEWTDEAEQSFNVIKEN